MIFRTINWQHNDSTERLLAEPVTPWKTQHNFPMGRFQLFRGNQARARPGKFPPNMRAVLKNEWLPQTRH